MAQCTICSTEFTVAPEDQTLLRKFDAPEPQYCFHHSLQRRMSYRNERHLYKQVCESCGKHILGMYSPASQVHVFCKECWFSDSWDPINYGREYDPTRPFFEQFFDLFYSVPQYNLYQIGENENCDYSNYVVGSKNAYLSFSNIESDGSVYSKNVDYSKDCVDNFQVANSELLYDCVNVRESYHCAFLTRSQNCTDCYLGRDLTDCQDCFGCVNLKHKRFYWFNEPLNEEEYRKRFSEAFSDRAHLLQYVKQCTEHDKSNPVEYAMIRKSEQCIGDVMSSSRNIRQGYQLRETENSGDLFRVYNSKEVYRCSYQKNGEYSYEVMAGPGMSYSVSLSMCPETENSFYSHFCQSASSVFGCVGLRNKRYCILNTQYSKEGYEVLKAEIVSNMKAAGEWGEFFPERYSPHGYNDTIAYEYFPLTKEKAMNRGWRWEEQQGGTFGKETIQPEAVPNAIEQTTNSITKEILRCTSCNKNYRIQPKELESLHSHHLPVPLTCQDCRFAERFKRDNLPCLYHRQCMCTQHHSEHTGSPCPVEFETPYAPSRSEMVYCHSCYQAEVT